VGEEWGVWPGWLGVLWLCGEGGVDTLTCIDGGS